MTKETFAQIPENDTQTAEKTSLRGKLWQLGRRAVGAVFKGSAQSPSETAPVSPDRATTIDVAAELGINTGAAPEPGARPNITDTLQPADVHRGAGDILKGAPTSETPIAPSIVPGEAPATPPEYAVTQRPGGVPPSAGKPPTYIA